MRIVVVVTLVVFNDFFYIYDFFLFVFYITIKIYINIHNRY